MLVLTRRQNETIVISECVEVQVLGIEGGRVRLGITAPAEVSIRRAELQPLEPARLCLCQLSNWVVQQGRQSQVSGVPS